MPAGKKDYCKRRLKDILSFGQISSQTSSRTTSKRHLVFRPDLLPDVFANDVWKTPCLSARSPRRRLRERRLKDVVIRRLFKSPKTGHHYDACEDVLYWVRTSLRRLSGVRQVIVTTSYKTSSCPLGKYITHLRRLYHPVKKTK